MNINQFDKTNLTKVVRPGLEKALAAVAAEWGVKIEVGSCRFDTNNVTFQVKLSTVGSDLAAEERNTKTWALMAGIFGLPTDGLGRTFATGGRRYTITGLSPQRRSYPVDAKRDDGKVFKFPSETVAGLLARQQ